MIRKLRFLPAAAAMTLLFGCATPTDVVPNPETPNEEEEEDPKQGMLPAPANLLGTPVELV